VRLPSGYRLDLLGDPRVIVMRREDETGVGRFTHNVDPEEIRQAAEEDHQGPPEAEGRVLCTEVPRAQGLGTSPLRGSRKFGSPKVLVPILSRLG
jgi:hypothetical protein